MSLEHSPARQQRRLIGSRKLRARFGGISGMTEWRWRKAGILPQPIKIGNRNYWDEEELDAVHDRLMASRDESDAR